MAKVIIDAGHGGMDPGAIHEGRMEKNDTLNLALAVRDILKKNGVDVVYTRTDDVYDTPFEKAQIANRDGGDFLISIHRNSESGTGSVIPVWSRLCTINREGRYSWRKILTVNWRRWDFGTLA